MVGDYVRAAAGLLPTTALLATMPASTVGTSILGGFAAIFAAFGLRTALRHGTRLELSETGLRAQGPYRTTIIWAELSRMTLAYYSTRRDRREGWMQLDLGTRRARLRLDSRIAGFDELVRRSALAAADRGLPLSETTLTNLRAIGVRVPEAVTGDTR
jgi:hypothetical protein